MNQWYMVNLGDAMLADRALDYLKQLFLSEYVKADSPLDMALFTRPESLGDLHCVLIAYLSPASALVAQAVGAEPCGRPSPGGLHLLAGKEAAWGRLFPGTS